MSVYLKNHAIRSVDATDRIIWAVYSVYRHLTFCMLAASCYRVVRTRLSFQLYVDSKQKHIIFRINCFESKLSPLRDTLMCIEGIVGSDHVNPRSILSKIIRPPALRLPTCAADGPRSVLG